MSSKWCPGSKLINISGNTGNNVYKIPLEREKGNIRIGYLV